MGIPMCNEDNEGKQANFLSRVTLVLKQSTVFENAS